jgi:hypothetical protein
MKNIFNKLLKFTSVNVPPPVKDTFLAQFGDSINVEWIQADDFYEAIFYLDEAEHIARYDQTGRLLNLKKNLPIQEIPEHIRKKGLEHGEIMNVIEVRELEIVGYELIVRDEALIRFSLLLNEKGGLIQKSKL